MKEHTGRKKLPHNTASSLTPLSVVFSQNRLLAPNNTQEYLHGYRVYRLVDVSSLILIKK